MDIDVSKENIQPLRGGRNLVQLGTALQAQSDVDAQRQLQLQKEEHEAAIRNYQGTDPLDPWFNYIQWVEQCYPKHGHEGHIDKLIKDCLQLFEKDAKYYQDRRFVKLWIKYIDCLANPLEIYQRLYNSGVGVECSEFYRAWACYCEESGDYKKANQVYMLGLQAKAQPIDELEQAHLNFQLFFAQRMLHDDSPTKRKAASALAETRMALTSLKSFKRRNIASAPVHRVGDSVRSIVPGVVRQGNYDNRVGNSNVIVNVYEDAPSTSSSAIPTAEPGPASLVQACSNVENEKEVGIWTNAKIKMVHANVVPHQPLPFVPYEDEDDELKLPANHIAYCVDDLVFSVPLNVPDPPDPTKITCYNKPQVYVDDTEYSLEEIRSRKYKLKPKVAEPPPVSEQSMHQSFSESIAQISALDTLANCALDAENEMAQLMPINIPTHITKVTHMHSPGEPKVLVNLDSKELSQLKRNDENVRPKENEQPQYGENQNYGRNNIVEEFNKSLMSNLLSDSVTVNTKEARWELRNIFNDNEPSMVQPIVQQYEVPKFDIHEDRSMTMAINTQRKPAPETENRIPQDKENASKYVVPTPVTNLPQNVNKTAYYEEPSCTQVFNFNIKDASTPNMSQFKKPNNIDNKMQVPKFNMDESTIENQELVFSKKEEFSRPEVNQHGTVDQGTGLSVIMEATREYNSKSGSSSSGQSTRTNFTGYATPYSEKTQASTYESMYHQTDPTSSKRNSVSSQPRLANGKFARAYPKSEEKPTTPFLSHDHQYQKPTQQQFNGYPPQQRMHLHYQQNYNYHQYPNQMPQHQIPQGYASPNPYQSPQHPGMQSPAVQPGFQSPTYNQQMPYHSPGHIMSPQHNYGREYQYHDNQTHYEQNPGFQSPPHNQYQNAQYYQRPNPQQNQNYQQNYHMQNQYASPQAYANTSHHQQSYNAPQAYRQENGAEYAVTNPPFQVYSSPQAQNTSYRQPTHQVSKEKPTPMQTSPDMHVKHVQSGQRAMEPQHTAQNKSPTAALRSVRHDQPNVKLGQNSPDAGFSNQFLNFISSRNEPKDNANTPKFSNSPSISQKMHKNLYVSSPEQGQIPPSSGLSDSDSKDGLTAQTITPIQSAKVTQIIDKQKDISKRQLDFEPREIISEDSRDSVSKESRISSVYSRQSDFQSDGYGMDVDSENSMECAAYKSTHSISLIETSEIPRPADIEFPSVIDPFNKKLLASLLEYVKFPNKTHAEGYFEVKSVPKMQGATAVTVGTNKFAIEKQLGKGNYGAVYLCLDLHSNKSVAVKYQKPSRPWEFYICQEIKARIKDPFMLPGYMDITTAYLGDNASLFISEYSKYGSLLDVANKVKISTSKCINEFIVFLLTSEMLSIVHYLHKAQIIHADIKPDNFLLMKIPAQEWRTPSLQLIDLGCAIDMSLFPDGTSFKEVISTEGFTCTEMRERRPWTYQTDLYCLAGTIHVILMGSYMKVTNRLGQWNIDKKLPRYMKVVLWDKIFTTLLNVPDCNTLPDLMELKNEVDSLLSETDVLGSQLRSLANILKSR